MGRAIGPAWPMGYTSHRYMPGTRAEGQVRGFPPVAPLAPRIGLAYSGWAERLCSCFPSHHKCSGDSERINRAAMAAVEARFVR